MQHIFLLPQKCCNKKISIFKVNNEVGEYGEDKKSLEELSTSTQLVCPMTSMVIKKEYGIDTTEPKKVIFNKSLPRDIPLLFLIDGRYYSVLERTDFDKFNILLLDIYRGNIDGE